MHAEPRVKIVPLGGLGEIGMNCFLLEAEEDLLVIDAGLIFPEEDLYGIDVVIPDFSYLLEHRGKVRGIVLTHGHEDHTGALPFLLHHLKVPIYGTRLSLGLVREKLKEFGLLHQADLRPVLPRERIRFGSLEVEFIQVCHSIPDGVAVAIRTPAGLVLHTGDFKFDTSPIDGRGADYDRFAELGEEGVLVLLSDSTNADRPGFTPSEQTVGAAFEALFQRVKGRVILACFASNIHRIQQVFDVSDRLDRKVTVTGKSMVGNVRVAMELGYLTAPEGTLVTLSDLKNLPPHQGVILTTGSQGEPLSAMARMASGEHKQVQVQPGDLVVFSARVIPGNEKAIARTINQLFKQGAEVIAQEEAGVHVSGHAAQEELKLMLALTRPRFFIPVHGEYRHLHFHTRLAQAVGLPKERIFLAEDGDLLEFTPSLGRFAGKVKAGRVFVDGHREVEDPILKDRRQLAQGGMVMVAIGVEEGTGKLLYGPELSSRGFLRGGVRDDLLEEAKEHVRATLESLSQEERADRALIEQRMQQALRRFLWKRVERRPAIVSVVIPL
ncbi:MAG: ribonuclease J [candidate division NC10 bacterium]|nr:ribonuclease J [candidate division NC10 bacterium]